MKRLKTWLIVLSATAGAGLLIGAKDGAPDRPAHIEAERWVKFSDTAGLALTDELSATRQLSGHLYIRTEKGWRPVSVLNPATAQLLDERAPRP